MDRSNLFTRPREYLPSLTPGVVMAIAIPACAFLDTLFKHPFDVVVNVWEMGDAGMGLSFPYNIRFVIRILLMAVIINVVFWVAFKHLLGKTSASTRFKNAIELAAMLVAIMGATGAVYHWGFDLASTLYRATAGYDGSAVLLYLYVNDEYIGHHLQHLGLFGYVAILVIVETRVPAGRRMHLDEGLFAGFITAVIAVTNAYGALKSESAFVLLVATSAMLAIQLSCVLIKRVNVLGSPLLLASIAGNVLVIVQDIVFIAMYGLSPWYPFLRPS